MFLARGLGSYEGGVERWLVGEVSFQPGGLEVAAEELSEKDVAQRWWCRYRCCWDLAQRDSQLVQRGTNPPTFNVRISILMHTPQSSFFPHHSSFLQQQK